MNQDLAQPPSFNAQLAQKRQAQFEAERQSTQRLLSLHATSLSELSQAAKSTTESILESQRVSLERQLAGAKSYVSKSAIEIGASIRQINSGLLTLTSNGSMDEDGKPLPAGSLDQVMSKAVELNRDLDKLTKQALKRAQNSAVRAVSVTLVAVVTLICLSVVLLSAGWAWWQVSHAEQRIQAMQMEAEKKLSDTQMQIKLLNAQFCSSQAGKQYCR